MQQTTFFPEYIEGIFIKELKNRFLCEVEISGESVVCYVPSSCHLSNFLKLEGKKVYLVRNVSKNTRTKYALFAVPYKRNYIILNTSMANRAIEQGILGRQFSYIGKKKNVLKEYSIDKYKCDLYIPESDTIIEIKSVISTNKIAVFPTVYSERTLRQLDQLNSFLEKQKNVCFMIVSLNPYVECISLDRETEFYKALQCCINNGLILRAYALRLSGTKLKIAKEIPILFDSELK